MGLMIWMMWKNKVDANRVMGERKMVERKLALERGEIYWWRTAKRSTGGGQQRDESSKVSGMLDEEMINGEDDLTKQYQELASNREEVIQKDGGDQRILGFLREEFLENILKEIEAGGISQTKVIQLLRDMKVTKESGEIDWESEGDLECQDPDNIMEDVNEILPMEIMPSSKELLELNQQEGGGGYVIPGGSDHVEKEKEVKMSDGVESKKSKRAL
jgi:hypothetical protein